MGLNYEKLLEVHAAGEAAGDSQLMDFVESEFLEDQLNSIKEISDWVTQLRRVGDGQGEFLFDQGLAAHFLKESEEERAHSMKFMEYQTLRGGSVQLQSIMMPKIEFPDSPRGDALYAMELSLALEKLNYEKLLEVHAAGEAAGDSQLMDFVE